MVSVVLQVENRCGEHSTEEQVQEIKHLLVKHMEQTGIVDDACLEVILNFFTPGNLRIFLTNCGTLEYYRNSIFKYSCRKMDLI